MEAAGIGIAESGQDSRLEAKWQVQRQQQQQQQQQDLRQVLEKEELEL